MERKKIYVADIIVIFSSLLGCEWNVRIFHSDATKYRNKEAEFSA